MRNKRIYASICLSVLLLSMAGCIHRQGTKQPVTPYEQTLVWNDLLAQTNDSIAKGIVQISPTLISPEKAAVILRQQKNIAIIDNQITAILKEGQDYANISSSQLQALLAQLKASVQAIIDSGAIGIKNPQTQQTFDADIQAVGSLADQILSGLRQAGVVK